MSDSEKDIKSIKLSLPYVDEQGVDSSKQMNVVFKNVLVKEKPEYNNAYSPTYSMNMSVVIPDHIHKKLVGAVVGRRVNFKDDNRKYPLDFSKTITGSSLEAVTERYRDVIYDYRWLIAMEKMETTKVIFYDFFGSNIEDKKSQWDSKIMGNDSQVAFSYMVGFISKDGKYRFNKDNKRITDQDGQCNKWEFIEHSDERELFFKSIFENFKELLSKLESFKVKISPTFIDEMINSGAKLLQ